ncbi:MAG: hypothetical protein IT201_02250 [Thermoleophilia bacterium]|nr:hypothetical protein [Thermoleophilia bacterium]
MGAIEHVGEAGLKIRLDLPDASLIDNFESEFRVLLSRFEQEELTHRLAMAALARREDGDDTAGYWFSWAITKQSKGGSEIPTTVASGYQDIISWL